jgi:hypothetical protein
MWICDILKLFSHTIIKKILKRSLSLEKTSLWKPLKFTLLHVSICSKLVRNFSNTLGFVSLCRYASLTTTFSFNQVHHQIDQNVKCIIIMRIDANSFRTYTLRVFPQNLGFQTRPLFVLGASQDAWTPFRLKACKVTAILRRTFLLFDLCLSRYDLNRSWLIGAFPVLGSIG